jgi:small subunit ribosomal protein S6
LTLYETTVVIDSMLKPDDIKNLRDRITNFISNNGGEIVKVEDWGKRRLAYEIKKKQYGFYVYLRFGAPPAFLRLLEKEYRLNESILRYLTVKLDKRALQREEMERQKPLAAGVEEEIDAVATTVTALAAADAE